MKISAWPTALLSLLLACTGVATAQFKGICSALSQADVRELTGAASGIFSAQILSSATNPQCLYRAGNNYLVLDAYHTASDAAALALMDTLGPVTNSNHNTASPYGTDQINKLQITLNLGTGLQSVELSGFAARHGSTVISIGIDKPEARFTPTDTVGLQGFALHLAGARLTEWPTVDVCARVPAASVQTLVALGPAKLLTSAHHSAGGNSDCTYEFMPVNGEGKTKVVLKSERWINDLEALAHDNSTRVALPFTTSDPNDTALTVAEPGYMAAALHQGELGRVDIYSPGLKAERDDSLRTHLAVAAMMATGGTITGGAGLQAIPPPVAPTPFTSAAWRIVNTLRNYWFLWLVLALTAWIFWRRQNVKRPSPSNPLAPPS